MRCTIDEVKLAWTDNGNKMWLVYLTEPNGDRGYFKTWAKDEIDAYNITNKQLIEKEQANEH